MGNTTIPTQSYRAMESGQSKSYIIPFALLCSLFFLWAVANNLNDILLPQFQQAFTLTNFQAGLIQSAFYFGYFIIPIPAGMLMKKIQLQSRHPYGAVFICLRRRAVLACRRSDELHLIPDWIIYYRCRAWLSGNRGQPVCHRPRSGKRRSLPP